MICNVSVDQYPVYSRGRLSYTDVLNCVGFNGVYISVMEEKYFSLSNTTIIKNT
jgi:hypothetical protein